MIRDYNIEKLRAEQIEYGRSLISEDHPGVSDLRDIKLRIFPQNLGWRLSYTLWGKQTEVFGNILKHQSGTAEVNLLTDRIRMDYVLGQNQMQSTGTDVCKNLCEIPSPVPGQTLKTPSTLWQIIWIREWFTTETDQKQFNLPIQALIVYKNTSLAQVLRIRTKPNTRQSLSYSDYSSAQKWLDLKDLLAETKP